MARVMIMTMTSKAQLSLWKSAAEISARVVQGQQMGSITV